MIYRFKTKCCPDANGRLPQPNEVKYTAHFTTADGAQLYVEMGEQGRQSFLTMLGWENDADRRENEVLKRMLGEIIAAGSGGLMSLRELVWKIEKEFAELSRLPG